MKLPDPPTDHPSPVDDVDALATDDEPVSDDYEPVTDDSSISREPTSLSLVPRVIRPGDREAAEAELRRLDEAQRASAKALETAVKERDEAQAEYDQAFQNMLLTVQLVAPSVPTYRRNEELTLDAPWFRALGKLRS